MRADQVIVVVEDELNMRELLRDFLSSEGFQVHTSGSGEEALRLMRTLQRIDLMLLDIMMPGIDGRQLLDYVRSSDLVRFPIIIVSAIKGEEQIESSYLHGTDFYITKPFELTDLLNAVEYFLGVALEPRRQPPSDSG